MPALALDEILLPVQYVWLPHELFPKGYQVPLLQHREIQIEYVLTGRFRFRMEGRDYDLRERQGLVIPAGTLHEWQCLRSGHLLGANLQVEGEKRWQFVQALRDSILTHPPFISSPACFKPLEALFAILRNEAQHPWLVDRVAHWVGLWLVECLEEGLDIEDWRGQERRHHSSRMERDRELCVRVLQYMQTRIASHTTHAPQVAKAFGLSVRHLNRVFQRHQQTSVSATLRQLRMEQAHAMLLDHPSPPIKVVAYSCGFTNPAYFSQCFKQNYGMAPSDLSGESPPQAKPDTRPRA